ncbi:hypothetical protein CFOL_v3_28255, partial [Cephalotus follicularis]
QLYRAKTKARSKVEGNYSESYSHLHKYVDLVRTTNPVTLYQGPLTFKRIFICYEASRKGFTVGCRPFIGIDGCHLKGPYGGVLLCAIALDGDQGLFPIAFVVVEIESRD